VPERQGKDKIKQTTDDILKLFTIIDEQMPRYAAADLARVSRAPFLNYDAINTIAMAKKIEAPEQRMNSFEHSVTSNLTQFVCNAHYPYESVADALPASNVINSSVINSWYNEHNYGEQWSQ